MNAKNYIKVIVPLKLDWEPVYSVPEGLEVAEGDRVSVIFSGKEYISVVSRTGVTPDPDLREDSIHSILDKVAQLPPVIIFARWGKFTTAFTSGTEALPKSGLQGTEAPSPRNRCCPLPRKRFTTLPLMLLMSAKQYCFKE